MSARLRDELVSEDLVLVVERVRGTVVLRDFRGPRAWSWKSYERKSVLCAVAVTGFRLVVIAGWWPVVNVPFGHAIWRSAEVSADGDRFRVFMPDLRLVGAGRAGSMDVRVCTPEAGAIAGLVSARAGR